MSPTERLALVSKPHTHFAIGLQCALLKVPRLTLHHKPKPISDDDLTLMPWIDEIYMKRPFYGWRKIVTRLGDERCDVNRKRVRQLKRLMRIEAIYRRQETSSS